MRKIILVALVLLSFVSKVSHGGYYDSVIVPVPVSALQDETMKEHIAGIFEGTVNNGLQAYKIKYRKNTVAASYKGGDWMFYTHLSEKMKTKPLPTVYCPANEPLLDDVRFYHMKSMLACTPHALTKINQELLAAFGGQQLTCEVRAYISKDRLMNYLYLNFTCYGKQLSYIFLIKKGEFYKCIAGGKT